MTAQHVTLPFKTKLPMDIRIRKRVCKACDRCRLKKLKCDGETPCSRCEADNALCVIGPRLKIRERVHPKGYVEMLEQQQAQLDIGLQELYRRIKDSPRWPGSPLKESSNGKPLTHDILERLGALKLDEHNGFEILKEDPSLMQQ